MSGQSICFLGPSYCGCNLLRHPSLTWLSCEAVSWTQGSGPGSHSSLSCPEWRGWQSHEQPHSLCACCPRLLRANCWSGVRFSWKTVVIYFRQHSKMPSPDLSKDWTCSESDENRLSIWSSNHLNLPGFDDVHFPTHLTLSRKNAEHDQLDTRLSACSSFHTQNTGKQGWTFLQT